MAPEITALRDMGSFNRSIDHAAACTGCKAENGCAFAAEITRKALNESEDAMNADRNTESAMSPH